MPDQTEATRATRETLPERIERQNKLKYRLGVLGKQREALAAINAAMDSLTPGDPEWSERGYYLRARIARELIANAEEIWELSGPGQGGVDAPPF